MWCPSSEYRIVGYCRVSSAKQRSSLDKQQELIRKKYPDAEIVRDVGSGFNFERKGLRALLERVLSGDAVTIVATTQDRLCRVGFPLIRWIVELHGGRVVTLEENDSPEEFDTGTLVAFVTSFINSYHGKRSRRRHAKDTSVSCGGEEVLPDSDSAS